MQKNIFFSILIIFSILFSSFSLLIVDYSNNIFLEEEENREYVITPNYFAGFQGGLTSELPTYDFSSEGSCFLGNDSEIYCWGMTNYNGPFSNDGGDDDFDGTPNYAEFNVLPTIVNADALNNTNIVALVAGNPDCFVMTNLSVGCLGADFNGQTDDAYENLTWPFGNTQVKSIVISESTVFLCIISVDENLMCTSSGSNGGYMFGSPVSWVLNVTITLPGDPDIHQISIGQNSVCAVTTIGELYCWGGNYYHHIQTCPINPISPYDCRWMHKINYLPENSQVVAVAVGSTSTCALLTNGTVYCWGSVSLDNQDSTLFSNQYITQINLGSSDILSLDAGSANGQNNMDTYCVVLSNGSVPCWGNNAWGQAGDFPYQGNDDFPYYNLPPIGEKYVAVDVMGTSTCAVTNESSIDCWGHTGSNGGYWGNGISDTSSTSGSTIMPTGIGIVGHDREVDNDGLSNLFDFCEDGLMSWTRTTLNDNDNDGCHDSLEDSDDDNDGYPDLIELSCLSSPTNQSSIPPDFDFDNDGICDVNDNDDDNDGYPDLIDDYPFNGLEWADTDNDGIGDNTDPDDDNDGWTDTSDDFPLDSSEWNDLDNDGIGDNADLDNDGDGWLDTSEDLCGTDQNSSTSFPPDNDGDFICDSQDSDDDNDNVPDSNDSFPNDSNEWSDADSDGIGDNSDLDDDNDGVPDTSDDFPLDSSESTDTDNDGIGNNADTDDDGDGIPDSSDDFPLDSTEDTDTDGDGIGNNADTDDDNDGWSDTSEQNCGTSSLDSSEIPDDYDNDGICDPVDSDDDGDGYLDSFDDFPLDSSEWLDTDNDGVGNNADLDDDNDGFSDTMDDFPLDSNEWLDTDNDGLGNNQDSDDDGDGIPDSSDDFPLDFTEDTDTDGDGIGNNADTDDDNDGWSDSSEQNCGTSSLDSSEIPDDYDNDGICDPVDSDDDNDGWSDTSEQNCGTNPLNNSIFPLDNDYDGICNSLDSDDDNDGIDDVNDEFPLDANEWSDNDGDGIGDNSDFDDDNDGWGDSIEYQCGKSSFDSNSYPNDFDNDGYCNFIDYDDDNDGWFDSVELSCGTNALNSQSIPLDSDNDLICDIMDNDDDNDLWLDSEELMCMTDPLSQYSTPIDTDYDGICNLEDNDDDNDGYLDSSDEMPLDSSDYLDFDRDGIGNSADDDDDNDGYTDNHEVECNSNPRNSTSIPPDSDLDYRCDTLDDFPYDPSEQIDSDLDGVGDNSDAFPLDRFEQSDSDSDGIGDNTDDDNDNDQIPNNSDSCPYSVYSTTDNNLDYDGDGCFDNEDDDDDNDSIYDIFDSCPKSVRISHDIQIEDVDKDGCIDQFEDLDIDNDGVMDNLDSCSLTPFGYPVNAFGCTLDSDFDGIPDDRDECEQSTSNLYVDSSGCDIDTDSDGVADHLDLFPLDSRQSFDTDGDGFGDSLDVFPYDSRENQDSDNDGVGDNSDICPNGIADNSGRMGCYGEVGLLSSLGSLGYILASIISGLLVAILILVYTSRKDRN